MTVSGSICGLVRIGKNDEVLFVGMVQSGGDTIRKFERRVANYTRLPKMHKYIDDNGGMKNFEVQVFVPEKTYATLLKFRKEAEHQRLVRLSMFNKQPFYVKKYGKKKKCECGAMVVNLPSHRQTLGHEQRMLSLTS